MLPTTTGNVSVISTGTLDRLADLRRAGHKLVLVTAARLSTLVARFPALPACDAYLIESGGRILFPDPSAPTAGALTEDLVWRSTHASQSQVSVEDPNPNSLILTL